MGKEFEEWGRKSIDNRGEKENRTENEEEIEENGRKSDILQRNMGGLCLDFSRVYNIDLGQVMDWINQKMIFIFETH